MTYRTFDGTSQTETIVDGRFSSDGSQYLKDNEKINLGEDPNILEVYSSGSRSKINSGDPLDIEADSIHLKNQANSLTMIECAHNGAAKLYYGGDSTAKLETTSLGSYLSGQVRIGSSGGHALKADTGFEIRGPSIGTNSTNGVGEDHFKALKLALNDDTEWGSQALFSLGRYEEYSSHARTSLKISLGHGTVNSLSDPDADVLLLKSDKSATFSGKVKLSAGNNDNYFYLINTTASDADSARYSRMLFQGTQSGGEVSSLAAINGAHDGTGDDEKGVLTFRTNDGNDSESPTVRVTIDSAGDTTFTENIILSKMKKVSFRDSGTQKAYIEIDSNNDVVYYGVSGTDHKFYANANPAVDINHDGIKLHGSRGIQFNTYGEDDSNAATTVTSNTLDDYEEGTWVPQFSAGFSAAAQTHGTDGAITVGSYTKVGNLVNVSLIIRLADDTAGGHPSTSNGARINISGLPFTSASTTYHYGVGSTAFHHFVGTTDATAPAAILIGTSSTTLDFYQGNSNFIGGNGSDQKAKTLYASATYHTTS